MNKIFPSNVVNVDWKRSGLEGLEVWAAKTPIGSFQISKKYLGAGYILSLPADYPGQNKIDCNTAEEAKSRTSEEIASRLNEILDAD